ncbi:MmgE/PrpD family protein [Actinomycetospora sp. C-140]
MTVLGELAARSRAAARDAGPETRRLAARQVVDVLGCVASGAGHPVARTWLPLVPPDPAGVTVPGLPSTYRLDDAVAVGATLAHLDELDPLHGRAAFAAGAVVVPTALALATARGAGGELLARAVVAGHEAGIEASLRHGGPALYARGLWPTAVFGPLAAAATAAVLLGLDDAATTAALALASAGLGGFLSADVLGHGHYLLSGAAARAGLAAALGARAGLSVSTTLLDGPAPALLGDAPAPPSPSGAPHLAEVATKTWPCARPLQAALAALDGTALRDGDTVVVALPTAAGHFVTDDPTPADPTAAAASAVVAVRGHAAGRAAEPGWYREVAAGAVTAPDITVRRESAADLDAAFPARWGAHVRVERGGRTVATASCLAPEPLDDAALLARASRLAGRDLTPWCDLDALPGTRRHRTVA